jgi:hypothetical protein
VRWRREPPAALTNALLPGERLLAWGLTERADPVGVTTKALYVPDAGAMVRVGHERIATATWEDPDLVVVLVGPDTPTYRLLLEQPGEVPPVLRERVTSTIVVTERVELAPGVSARITARRPPGGDDVLWAVVFDPGVDATDPELRQLAGEEIERIRTSRGV